MKPPIRYGMMGILLGLGAPLGSLGLRILLDLHRAPIPALVHELQSACFYYVYMTLGSVVAFGLFGLLLGQKNERLKDLSTIDGLTDIYNHRYLQELLSREIARSHRYGTPITCLMLDIDDFKQINDLHGHPFGDGVLVQTAKIIRESVRTTDTAGRYGGEEFLVIMPQTNSEQALPIAQRIVNAVHAIPITISGGLATYLHHSHGVKTKNSLLSAADQALYQAKRNGKNRVTVWKP